MSYAQIERDLQEARLLKHAEMVQRAAEVEARARAAAVAEARAREAAVAEAVAEAVAREAAKSWCRWIW